MGIAWLEHLARAAPSRCAVCGAWPAQPLCRSCLARFAAPGTRCGRCALPLPPGVPVCGACLRDPPPLDACFAAVPYAYPWSGLVARYKFRGEAGWAALLAGLMRGVPGVEQELARADLVLPMPLAPARLAERGFNQALQLARQLGGSKADALLLLRLRDTAAQASLPLAQRRANVQGSLGVEPLRREVLQGSSVLLVDDVMTTGASLHAAARALHEAGAARVAALVLARTEAVH